MTPNAWRQFTISTLVAVGIALMAVLVPWSCAMAQSGPSRSAVRPPVQPDLVITPPGFWTLDASKCAGCAQVVNNTPWCVTLAVPSLGWSNPPLVNGNGDMSGIMMPDGWAHHGQDERDDFQSCLMPGQRAWANMHGTVQVAFRALGVPPNYRDGSGREHWEATPVTLAPNAPLVYAYGAPGPSGAPSPGWNIGRGTNSAWTTSRIWYLVPANFR